MERFRSVLNSVLLYAAAVGAILLIGCGISYAADSELTVSGSHSDTEGGMESTILMGELLAPLGPVLVGFTVEYMDEELRLNLPPGQAKKVNIDLDGIGLGAAVEWNITGDMWVPFIGAGATYWRGDFGDAFDYSLQARAGIKVGTGSTFLKVQYTIGKDYGGGNVPDRDRDQAFLGFGRRF